LETVGPAGLRREEIRSGVNDLTGDSDYKEWVAGVFDRSAASYDRVGPRFFTHFGRGLVEFAQMRPGSRVLDVACGKGAVLIPASEQVGVDGEVIGIDISPAMVSRLAGALERQELSNATVVVMDAEALEFPDTSFDHVLCGLALFFFPNLDTTLGECFRLLRPGGTLAVSTLAGFETPWGDSLSRVAKRYRDRLATAPSADTRALGKESEVTAELLSAGFTGVEHQTHVQQFFFRDEAEWWRAQWSIFQRGFMERLDATDLERYKGDVLRVVATHVTSEGIPTSIKVRYSRAKRPVPANQASGWPAEGGI
jgi:ubiquinone/menaquinone biosynthesis C-methylase UbiE